MRSLRNHLVGYVVAFILSMWLFGILLNVLSGATYLGTLG